MELDLEDKNESLWAIEVGYAKNALNTKSGRKAPKGNRPGVQIQVSRGYKSQRQNMVDPERGRKALKRVQTRVRQRGPSN